MKIKITWLIAVCAALGFWFSEVSAQSVRVSRYQERAEYAISRADYKGRLAGDTLIFNAQLTVELFSDRATKIIFFPSKVTLREVRLDGKPAAIFHNGSAFELSAQGKGSHKISVEFESPVSGGQDRPAVQLSTPSIPVSRFEITLPGKKKLVVSPAAEIKHSEHGADTKAEFFSPINGSFSISWSDVLPSTRAEARVDAEVAQALSTEDGIVSISTLVESEISRGAVGGVKIRVPSLVNVIEVASPQKIVADWRVLKGSEESNILEVIFPRPIENSFNIEILSDFALKKEDNHFKVPVFEVEGAYRQRGMVALVQSKNAMLNPVQEEGATRATDNLLPNWIRSRIDGQVTRTYKYVAGIPALRVQPVAPELPPARFNAESISLLSIGDLSLQGQFITDVVVKAGALNGLNIKTPAAINIISVSAPSLAGHKVDPLQEGQLIRLDFTQRIEGQFRVEVKYEQLLDENKAAVSFPMFEVEKAELQQGYLAVEALSAVEISASGEENFTSLEPKELPQQLVQRSSNPILLAYKYLRTTPLPQLELKLTRHSDIETKTAMIERAAYKTLYTSDGTAVTVGELFVRNSDKQFLKLVLPKGSSLWGVTVNGKREKPSLSQHEHDETKIMIKLISSPQGFPVTLVYQTPVNEIGYIGRVSYELPKPDLMTAHTRLDIFLPNTALFGRVRSNMNPLSAISAENFRADFSRIARSGDDAASMPFAIASSKPGVAYSFERLYSDAGGEALSLSVPYAASAGKYLVYLIIAALSAAFVWQLKIATISDAAVTRKNGGILIALTGLIAFLVLFIGAPLSPIAAVFLGGGLMELLARRKHSKSGWLGSGRARAATEAY